MTQRAPGFDPQNPSRALRRADRAESRYMDQGDGDSEERLFVALDAFMDINELARELFVAESEQGRGPAIQMWRGLPASSYTRKHWERVAALLRIQFLGTPA